MAVIIDGGSGALDEITQTWVDAGKTAVPNGSNLVDANDLGTAAYVDTIDEDDMASDSATAVPTQQSVKAYVDANAGGASDVGDLTTTGLTAANMLRVAAAGGLEERTPAQVLTDIGITASAANINNLITGKWKMWGCVIRSNAGTWEILNNTDHTTINVSSISQDSGKIDITLSFTASKVITALAVPDEIYVGKYNFGVSMGVSTATVYCRRMVQGGVPAWICTNNLASAPYFAVASFQGGAAAPASVTWNAGVLTINHAVAQPVQGVPAFSSMGFDVVPSVATNTLSYTSTAIRFHNLAGTQLTDPSTGGGRDFPASYRFVFQRAENALGYATLNPNSAELQISNSNIWLFGISEVA